MSTTGFPTSYRWSAYVTHTSKRVAQKSDFFVFTAPAYARAVSGVVILSACLSASKIGLLVFKTETRTRKIFVSPVVSQQLTHRDHALTKPGVVPVTAYNSKYDGAHCIEC